MSWLFLVVGAMFFGVGIARTRQPWARYQALKAQEANIARYESWRGGVRDSGPTGASVALDVYRKAVRDGVILAVAGIVLGVVGLFLR